ncbi:unnamed protein product [Rangifer tarandus platyrhynchus]|uniref:Uncharacterized protein n=1 Tax=Rangifer tarandus platyrhynchus TaxID=3082113 RepID=A0AC59YS16_RANTA
MRLCARRAGPVIQPEAEPPLLPESHPTDFISAPLCPGPPCSGPEVVAPGKASAFILGPRLPREFPLSCPRWQSVAGCQETQGPARSTLLGPPPSCGSEPLPVGCDCSFPAVPPVPPVPTLHFGGLAL